MLVAYGFTQRNDIDYKDTFSHMTMLKSISIVLAITSLNDYENWQIDVKMTFLNGYLEEDVCMK